MSNGPESGVQVPADLDSGSPNADALDSGGFYVSSLDETGFDTKPYDPEPGRDQIRAIIAIVLIGLFCFEVATLIAFTAFGCLETDQAKELATLTIPPTIGLAGAATGFYYGTRPKDNS